MNLERLVNKCNAMLRTELGFQDGGEYAWKYSEDLRRMQRVLDGEGQPVREYRALASGLILAYDKYRIVPMFDHRVHLQWVLAKRVMPDISESDWLDQFGSSIPYPANGEFMPVSPVYLDRGVEPSEDMTWAVIRSFRAQRKVKASEIDDQTEAGMERRKKDKYNTILDDIKDCGTAFCGIPGTKEHYSFGGLKDVELAPSGATTMPH